MLETKLCKIVYFDEESVADYVQIIDGGVLEKSTELLNDVADSASGGGQIKGKIGISKIIRALLGSNLEASAEASANTTYSNERIVKNIIKNTILTDFISIIEKNGKEEDNAIIRKFKGYEICAAKDSLSYILLISPYLSMLKGEKVPAGDYDIAIEKIDRTIKEAKGYYEFIGNDLSSKCNSSKETVIFRFNIKSFKNNYKPTDLLKMDLTVFAVKVGRSTINKLNIDSEFNLANVERDNPSYCEPKVNITEQQSDNELAVYDVLLAGVETE